MLCRASSSTSQKAQQRQGKGGQKGGKVAEQRVTPRSEDFSRYFQLDTGHAGEVSVHSEGNEGCFP